MTFLQIIEIAVAIVVVAIALFFGYGYLWAAWQFLSMKMPTGQQPEKGSKDSAVAADSPLGR